jgi:uncharacterized membrane protein
MSLGSGRKLGVIASLITVILPVVTVIAAIFMVQSFFATIQRWVANQVAPTFSILSAELSAFFIVLVILAIVGLVGFILFILAMHQLSHYYKESGIFKNIAYALIINIVGAIFVFALFFVFISSSINSAITTPSNLLLPFLNQVIFSVLALVVVALGLGIISAVFYMRAFNKLGEKSGLDSFKAAGVLYFVGVLLSIVLFGGVLVWIAWIFVAWGFYSLKPSSSSSSSSSNNIYSTPSTTTSPTIVQTKPCPNCGVGNVPEALYCGSCGKQLQGTSPVLAQTKSCPNCGTENTPDAIYCRSCGNQLNS